jgi:hypothetical protein
MSDLKMKVNNGDIELKHVHKHAQSTKMAKYNEL